MDHPEKARENRAVMSNAEQICCENCCEQVIFHMEDTQHRFSMGLSTVMECLIFAIQTGNLPKLPMSWLSDVDSVCCTDYALDQRNCYPDQNFPRKSE